MKKTKTEEASVASLPETAPLNHIVNRYDFTVVYSIKDGNPNGDPDAGNRPRVDDATNHGLQTAESLKYKIRRAVELIKENSEGFDVFSRSGIVANDEFEKISDQTKSKSLKDCRPSICSKYWDIRAFGGMLSTGLFSGDSNGQLRGPVQLSMGRSVNELDIQHLTITRCYVTDKKDAEKERTMGGRYFTPFGLYVVHGYVGVPMAKKTGFSQEDIDLLFNAITHMFENDNSSGRFGMGIEKFYVFKHNTELGSLPQHMLNNSVLVKLKDGVTHPRTASDYTISIDEDVKQKMVGKVELIELV